MTKTASHVVAADGTPGQLSAEHIVDLGIKHGAFRPSERAAVLARAQVNASAVLTDVCRVMAAARAVTPATPATAASGASGAGGSGDGATPYPSAWQRAVSAATRVTGRRAQPVKSAWPTVTPSAHVAGTTAPSTARSADGFYDKSVQPSAQAAAQEAARRADIERMGREQAARFSA
jgi:hypothetical protein